MLLPTNRLEDKIYPLKVCQSTTTLNEIKALRLDRYRERYPSIKNPDHDAFDDHSIVIYGENEKSKVISSCRLVFDSPLGLPEDPLFSKSADCLRRQRKSIVEASRFVNRSHSTKGFKEYYRAFYQIGMAFNLDVILFVMEEKNFAFHHRMLNAELLPERDETGFGCNLTFVSVAWHLDQTPKKFYQWAKTK